VTLLSTQPEGARVRRLSSFQWNRDGRRDIAIEVCEDVPVYDEGMVRRAILRASLLALNAAELRHGIIREMFEIGLSARMRADSDGSLVVEVSRPRRGASDL
jgi:hypothetical protein